MSVFTIYFTGQIGVEPARAALNAPEYTLAQVAVTGFLNRQPNAFTLQTGDFVFAKCSDGSAIFKAINDGSNITLSSISNPGEVSQIGAAVVGNIPKYNNTSGDLQDSGVVAANVLQTTTTESDYQQFIGLGSVILTSAGTWTRTRIAEGNYVLRHTAAADTTIMGIDITPKIRTASGMGFELTSIDVVYSIGTLALNAHTMTLDKIIYANNSAVTVTSVPLTGSLATATQASPYVSNISVTTPAYNNTASSKYVAELTINAAATSAYDFYGLNLHFTKSVA